MSSTEHPYSEAFVSDPYVFISGALSVDAEGTAVEGRREAVDAALVKLEARLALAGLGLEHVVKTVYYAIDVSLRDEANASFLDRFAEPRPARSFIGVSALPYGCTVEIEAVAVKQPVRDRL